MTVVRGLASGWFRGEQERDSGGQNSMVKTGNKKDSLRTADRQKKGGGGN